METAPEIERSHDRVAVLGVGLGLRRFVIHFAHTFRTLGSDDAERLMAAADAGVPGLRTYLAELNDQPDTDTILTLRELVLTLIAEFERPGNGTLAQALLRALVVPASVYVEIPSTRRRPCGPPPTRTRPLTTPSNGPPSVRRHPRRFVAA